MSEAANQVRVKLKTIMSEVFGIQYDEINDNMNIDNVISWDSLGHLRLISEIEKEFSIQLNLSEISEILDYKSIKTIVLKHLKMVEL